jgi:hypothetical protein
VNGCIFPCLTDRTGILIQRHQRFVLWIDSVASVLVCPQDEIWVGQAVDAAGVQLPFQANLRRRHLKLLRQDGRYWLQSPERAASAGAEAVGDSEDGPTLVAAGSEIPLSEGLGLRLRIPSPLTSTAVLDYLGPLRSVPRTDFAVLMAQACLMGSSSQHHILIPELNQATLFYQGGDLSLRCEQPMTVQGEAVPAVVKLRDGDRVESADFALTLEVL